MPAPPSLVEQVEAARQGDAVALRALYDSHVDAVFGYCLRFARGDRDRALDLTQDAFATAFAKLDGLRETERFSGWLRTITRRTCLRWAERMRVERQALDRLVHEPPTPSHTLTHASRVVAEVIAACPDPGQRAAAELFYTDPPHSTAQIAAALSLSRTAVTSRLHRFRQWARSRMLTRLAEAMEEPT